MSEPEVSVEEMVACVRGMGNLADSLWEDPAHTAKWTAAADYILKARDEIAEMRKALDWISDKVREGIGTVEFGITENGNVGIWVGRDLNDEKLSTVHGDTAEEALAELMERHAEIGLAKGASS